MSAVCAKCGALQPLPVLGEIRAEGLRPDEVRFHHEVTVSVNVTARVRAGEAPALSTDRDAADPGEVEILDITPACAKGAPIPVAALDEDELEGLRVIAAHVAE